MFVIAGEALIDFIATDVGSFRPVAGGAPFNFARALALQGVATGYANPLSSDHFGTLLNSSLTASGAIHLGPIIAQPTSLAIVSKSADGQPSYQFYREGVADRALSLQHLVGNFSSTTFGFHSGGLALVPPDHALIVHALGSARDKGILCTLDVNMRMRVAHNMSVAPNVYRDAARAAMAGANIVKVSDEDLLHLGFSGAANDTARALLDEVCKVVIVTLGANGAWVLSASQEIFQSAQSVKVVDTVGAGDCFFAGFIASLIRDNALQALRVQVPSAAMFERALQHATRCAAINIAREGCQPPSWAEASSST